MKSVKIATLVMVVSLRAGHVRGENSSGSTYVSGCSFKVTLPLITFENKNGPKVDSMRRIMKQRSQRNPSAHEKIIIVKNLSLFHSLYTQSLGL